MLIYRYRDWIAVLPAATLVTLLLAVGMRVVKPLKPREQEPVKLQFIEVEPARAEPQPELRSQPKPLPLPRLPQAQPQPPRPQPAPMQPPAPASAAAPLPATPVVPQAASAPPAPVAPPVAPVAQARPAAPKPDVEAQFVARVRAYLNSVKRYPTGREASLQRPEGTVTVWFILTRDGVVVDAGIEESSNSMLLDQAARRSISIGQFPPFPEQFQPGKAQHRFVVDLQFKPAGS